MFCEPQSFNAIARGVVGACRKQIDGKVEVENLVGLFAEDLFELGDCLFPARGKIEVVCESFLTVDEIGTNPQGFLPCLDGFG
jgi:hypothetical protein